MIITILSSIFLIGFVPCNEAVVVPTIKLNDGRDIPAIALGTWLGNNTKGRIEPGNDEAEKAVSWAIDAGYRHIDTAYMYKTEDQVGRAIKKKIEQGMKREEFFVTTKLWNPFHARAAVVPALQASLAQLGLEYVDLYLIHWPCGQFANKSYDYTDYLDTYRGMEEARSLGLTRSIGVSNFNESQIQRIMDAGLLTPAVLQVEVNLNLQQPQLLAFCRAHNITVMGYTPFGALHGIRQGAPPPRADDHTLVEMAERYGKSVHQIVLRYLLELGVIPIPKSITKSRIEENVNIFDFTLSDEDKALLKAYDCNYRILAQTKWKDHPYFPF